jgi:flagellar biosynthetic protein FlhB
MADESDRDQRTEQPTAKRLREAQERGQVPRSRELAGTAVLMASAATLWLAGSMTAGGLADVMRRGLTLTRAHTLRPELMTEALGDAVFAALLAIAPLLGVTLVAALVASALVGGLIFSGEALALNLSRLDPLAGLRRLFGVQGLVELGKALAKFVVVGGVAVILVWSMMERFVSLGSMSAAPAIVAAAQLLALDLLWLSAALVLVAAVDVPFQVWKHRFDLRMTKHEVKEELKETDGRPEVRSRIRGLQLERARRRMILEVPKADVVVMNPTHYAVALRYEPAKMRAPKVVAKGRDLLALEIRRIATQHGVAVFESPPLARALYASTKLDREIPSGLYVAVAQVLTYVYQLRAAGPDAARVRRPEPRVDASFAAR